MCRTVPAGPVDHRHYRGNALSSTETCRYGFGIAFCGGISRKPGAVTTHDWFVQKFRPEA